MAVSLIILLAAISSVCFSEDFLAGESRGGIIDRSGQKMRLTEGDSVFIKFSDRQYTLHIDKVENDYVTAHIGNEPAKTILEGYGEVFNAPGDETFGIMVEAVGVIGKDVNLRVLKVENKIAEVPKAGVTGAVVGSAAQGAEQKPQDTGHKRSILYLGGLAILIIIAFLIKYFVDKRR